MIGQRTRRGRRDSRGRRRPTLLPLTLLPLTLVPLALLLAACGSGGGSAGGKPAQSASASLAEAGTTVQAAMATYLTAVSGCAKQTSPVVCLEVADHTLGDKIHAYANLLAGHRQLPASKRDLTSTLNAAQTLANSLEILGDAEPTQANYDQVLNSFNINSAVTQLQGDVTTLGASIGK